MLHLKSYCVGNLFILCFALSSYKIFPTLPKQRYLIEFRDIEANFRIVEFKDLLSHYCNLPPPLIDDEYLNTECLISSVNNEKFPVLMYSNLPSEDVARRAIQNSALIRSVIEVLGEGKTIEETCQQSIRNINKVVTPTRFNPQFSQVDNTWRVVFRRYGRGGKSGLNPAGKRQQLHLFREFFTLLNGVVDLDNAKHEFILYEDCSDYYNKTALCFKNNKTPNEQSTLNIAVAEAEESYTASRYLLGRVVANGPSICNVYDIRYRPFIGTTTMSAVSAHLAAVAAGVKANDLVLDPYCGTGSLLISCAHLGANVVGSDYDSANFALESYDESSKTKELNISTVGHRCVYNSTGSIEVKKPNVYKRSTESMDQTGKDIYDNFIHYNLTDRCLAMISTDSVNWIPLSPELDQSSPVVGPFLFPFHSPLHVPETKLSIREDHDCSNTEVRINAPLKSNLDQLRIIFYPDVAHEDAYSLFGLHSSSNLNRDLRDTPIILHNERRGNKQHRRLYTVRRDSLQLNRQFDAIVSDPPFGIREKAYGHAQIGSASCMGDSERAITTLLLIATHRLRVGGKIAFWLPTSADVNIGDVQAILSQIENFSALAINEYLQFSRATPQHLHSKLCRWLVVYRKFAEPHT